MNSEEILKEMTSIYAEYQKELAVTSFSETGSLFIGLATETDTELIKNLLTLPSEFRSGLINYIRTYRKSSEFENWKETTPIGNENATKKQDLKDLLLASPHKDIEIGIDRSAETGRDIHL